MILSLLSCPCSLVTPQAVFGAFLLSIPFSPSLGVELKACEDEVKKCNADISEAKRKRQEIAGQLEQLQSQIQEAEADERLSARVRAPASRAPTSVHCSFSCVFSGCQSFLRTARDIVFSIVRRRKNTPKPWSV